MCRADLRLWLFSLAALLWLAAPVAAQGVAVNLDGKPLLNVGASASLTAPERAGIIEHRLQNLVDAPELPIWRVDVQGAQVNLQASGAPILSITSQDLEVNHVTDPAALAVRWQSELEAAIRTAREQRSGQYLAIAAGLAIAATLAALFVNWLAGSLFHDVRRRLEIADFRVLKGLTRVPYLSNFDPRPALLTLNVWGLWAVRLGLLNLYVLVVLGLFPQTRPFSHLLLHSLTSSLSKLGLGLIGYLPNMVTITVAVVVTYYAVKVIRVIFAQMKANPEELGFSLPVDLLAALGHIVVAVAWIFCVMIIAPLLPGLGSQTGQVIGLLIGAMITFSSGSTIGNAIAGLVLAYMRPFEKGDRVRIGDTVGDVLERNFTNVRLLTFQREVITLTTQAVLSLPITNYTTPQSREGGLLLHTSVTIGYDVPRLRVEATMLEAARRSEGIATDPAPFVLIAAFENFSVRYELNATTFYPHAMVGLYSELHKHLLDAFNEAGIEILTPSFHALRDGSAPALAPTDKASEPTAGPSLIAQVLRQYGHHPHYRDRQPPETGDAPHKPTSN